MAVNYLRSTDGSDADNGSTWALANATFVGAMTDSAASDTTYLSAVHSESTASAITITSPGTVGSRNKFLCVNDTGNPSPPTALATTALVATTGASNISLNGSFYAYGITFKAGSGSTTGANILFNNSATAAVQAYDNCEFWLNNTNTASRMFVGGSTVANSQAITWRNCTVRFSSGSHRISPRRVWFKWEGGSIDGTGSSPSALLIFDSGGNGGIVEMTNVDLSNLLTTSNIIDAGSAPVETILLKMNRCKLPASWTGSFLSATTLTPGFRVEARACDNAGTNYKIHVEDYFGRLVDETTIVRSGGASDGTTGLSWSIGSNSVGSFPDGFFATPNIEIWNDTSGSSKTVTIEIVNDGHTFTNAELALEVLYYADTGDPLGAYTSSAKSDVMASASNYSTSTATWTTTGLTSPVKQKMSVTFTPQQKGLIVARVLNYSSQLLYVDPLLTVT